MERLNIIWIIIIEIILTVYTECPLPWELLRRVGILLPIYQIYLCGHSNRHQVMDQKSADFFKNFRGQRYKNEEDSEELWAERRRELPPRQERSPRRHGAGPHQDEPAAGARVKTSVERRRPTAFRDGGLTVFLFKTGKYWNGKGRNIPYKWRFKSRNLAQRPKLRFGCLTKRR